MLTVTKDLVLPTTITGSWIAFYTCAALVQGTNIVRRELGRPEARVRIADPRYAFAAMPGR